MMTERSEIKGNDRVVPLHRRAWSRRTAGDVSRGQRSTLADLSRYEGAGDDPDDYRRRMINNGLAFLLCLLLVVAGVWLATRIAEMRKNQDCVLSGQRNCTPVEVPPSRRW